MKQVPWKWFDHRTDLPKWLTSGIGQIAAEWSVLERELEETIRLLADADIRYGRMLTSGMTARTRVKTATNLVQDYVYRDRLAAHFLADFIKIGERITEKIEGDRNLMVHGLWDRKGGQWYVLQNAGSRTIPQLVPDIKKLARAVLPQYKPVTAQSLSDISDKIVAVTSDVVKFCQHAENALNALQPPLRSKSPVYTRRHHQPRAHTRKADQAPPES